MSMPTPAECLAAKNMAEIQPPAAEDLVRNLAEDLQRCEAASPGLWALDEDGAYTMDGEGAWAVMSSGGAFVCSDCLEGHPAPPPNLGMIADYQRRCAQVPTDAAEGDPADDSDHRMRLLAEVDRLRQERLRLRACIELMAGSVDTAMIKLAEGAPCSADAHLLEAMQAASSGAGVLPCDRYTPEAASLRRELQRDTSIG
jgi:hypothetical protein